MVTVNTNKEKQSNSEQRLLEAIWETYIDLCEDDPVLRPVKIKSFHLNNNRLVYAVTFKEEFTTVRSKKKSFVVALDAQNVLKQTKHSAKEFLDYLTQQLKQKRWEGKSE